MRYPQVTWMVDAPVPEDFTRRENRTIYEAVAEAAQEGDKVTVDAEGSGGRPARRSTPALVPHYDRVLGQGRAGAFQVRAAL